MITIGTWNLENLFRPGAESGPSSEQAYQAKLAALAASITAIAPDVLGVQEVGQPEALGDLVDRLPGNWHSDVAAPDRRGIRVGFISRLPLTDRDEAVKYPDGVAPVQVDDAGRLADRMGRPALRVRVAVNGMPLTVVCCHLKSKLLTYPGGRFGPRDEDERVRFAVYALGRRAAESATVHSCATRLLEGAGQERAVVVLGDLNDEPQAATTALLHGPPGSEIGTPGFVRPDKGDGARLWNLAPLIPSAKRHSRTYHGKPELIDHILVSHALLDLLREVTTGDTPAGSVTDNPTERRDAPASDHQIGRAHV